jgi:Sgf11 (transcriptional regulation protein)
MMTTEDKHEKVRILIHQQRQRLYPSLYSANSNVKKILDHFAVDYYLDENDDMAYDSSVVEPPLKKSKHHQPETAVIDDSAMEHVGQQNENSETVGKFNDEHNCSDDTAVSTLKVESNTDCSMQDAASHQTSRDVRKDIVVPSEIPSSNLSCNDDTLQQQDHQPQQQQQEKHIIEQTVPVVTSSSSSSSSSVLDIWGHIPPREFIPATATSNNDNNNTTITINGNETVSTCMMICSICQQKVGSSLRYASHLDKCLGIGTMSRNASSSTSSV